MSVGLTIAATSMLVSIRPSAAETEAQLYLRDSGLCWVEETLDEATGLWSRRWDTPNPGTMRGGPDEGKYGNVPGYFGVYGYVNKTNPSEPSIVVRPLRSGGLTRRLRQVPCAPPQTASSGGFYIGGNVAGNFNGLGQTEMSKTSDVINNRFSDSSQAMGFGLNAGFLTSPWNNNILIGPSASIDIMKQDTIHDFPPGPSFLGQTINAIGTLNGQIGVVAQPGFFIFGELGAAFVNLDQKLNFSGPVTSVNQTVTGLNLGFGATYQPPGWQIAGNPVSLVGQFNHIILPGAIFDNPGSPGFIYRNDNEINEFKFGVRVQFGGTHDDVRTQSGAGTPSRAGGSGLPRLRRVAKKDDKTTAGGKPPQKPDQQQTISELPTVPVTGGTLHRGTGTYEGSPSINCWVERTDQSCKDYKEYQFVEVDVTSKWGNGVEQNINADVNKAYPSGIRAKSNTAITKPGSWGADEYGNATGNQKEVTFPDTKEKKKGGPYRPRDIPGKKGATGLEDAPSWQGFGLGLLEKVAPKDVLKPPSAPPSKDTPNNVPLGTIKISQHFRVYVYCDNNCLGYFEWTYDETLTYAWSWKERPGSVSEAVDPSTSPVGGRRKPGQDEQEEKDRVKKWDPVVLRPSSKIDGPKIGEWHPCP